MKRQATCPACVRSFPFDNLRGGQSVACPHCGEPMRLPERVAEPGPPPATLDYATKPRRSRAKSSGLALIGLAFIALAFMAVGLLTSILGGSRGAAGACFAFSWIFGALALIVGLAGGFMWPIRVAYHRGHPQREAVEIAALCGLLFFPFWLAACIWAHTVPEPEGENSSE